MQETRKSAVARPSQLVSKLRALEAEFEASSGANSGRPRPVARLYREVWDVLTGEGEFGGVRECSRRAAGLASWVEKHVRFERRGALGKALLEHTEFGASREAVCHGWSVHPSEWVYLRELAAWLGEKVARGRPLRLWPGEWLSEVEEYHEEVSVAVESTALQDMLLGALEAYSVPKGRGARYSEVVGMCFGSVKTQKRSVRGEGSLQVVHVLVRRVALQLRAYTTAGSVAREPRSEAVHLEMAAELFPDLELVGDFHSHPYSSLVELRAKYGWAYSPADEEENQSWIETLASQGHPRPRVSLILAIARAGRARSGKAPGPNVLRATFGRCHCYLAAYRINRNGTYGTNHVSLRCPTITGLSGSG